MVNLKLQRRLAAQILKCAPEKVRFDSESLADIKESITKADIKGLIGTGAIDVRASPGSSRVRARKILVQKRKGLRKGHGSRKGTANARDNKKELWINRIRKQRTLLKSLKDKNKLEAKTYTSLSNKAKGGYFRSERHLKTYITENKLLKNVKKA
ncbi:50S ribosomal protein L19e [Candidatus Woesearchaeota archaeon]|nr:50S ribosomal protein L19e [Candidatus Woesearchaeota archaeon]